MFTRLPELAFVLVACINAIGICGCYASSRAMLTSLATPETIGGWFGLYALSGTVTIWLGSALIGIATSVLDSQQAGFAALIALLAVGWIGMLWSRESETP